jgi:hypothetical protein
MTRRADLDKRAYELRGKRLPYPAIAKWLGGGFFGTSGCCARPEKSADHTQRSRE